MLKNFILSFLSLILPYSSALATSGPAGCLIRVDGDRLLVVKESWSKRYSLPGGMAEKGERPEQTAIRETREETGLDLQIEKLLGRLPTGLWVFSCYPQSETISLLGNNEWYQAPHSQIDEIEWIELKKMDSLNSQNWRFGDQVEEIKSLFNKNPLSSKVIVNPIPSPSFFREELKLIDSLQKRFHPQWDFLFKSFSFLGEESFLILLVPIVAMLFSYALGLDLLFLCLLSAIIIVLMKSTFQIDRPFYFGSILKLQEAVSFGFPSGHATLITAIWGFLAFRTNKKILWVIAFLLALLGGLARIYLGVHFIHDVMGGWLIGIMLAFLMAKWDIHQKPKSMRYIAWFALLFPLSIFMLVMRFHPESVSVVSLIIGLLLTRPFNRSFEFSATNYQLRLGYLFLSLFGLCVIRLVGTLTHPEGGEFLPFFIHRVLFYISIGGWFGFMPKILSIKINRP